MGALMEKNLPDSENLLERARVGDREALNSLIDRYRDRLRRMVEVRLDTRLQARLDASDVVQEAFVEVTERLAEYLRDPKLPLNFRALRNHPVERKRLHDALQIDSEKCPRPADHRAVEAPDSL
jgi:DNA-directed RNA polymerase specialized sigma24 family protein